MDAVTLANIRNEWINIKKMVIIDECSQVTEHLLTLIVVQLQEFKDSHRPWGNISVVLQGDFHQFPPTFGRSLYKENGATFGQFETIILKRTMP